MKISTIMVVFAAAFCVAGCKYSSINEGSSNGDSLSDIKSIEGGDGSGDAVQSGTLDSATEGKFEDLYTRCTDVNFAPVYFGFDSTVISQDETAKIDAVVGHLAEHTDRVAVIEGNCDERGSNEYNMSLGENRAIIVRNYLVQNGIAADRIQTRSYGEEKPAVEGSGEAAWSKNRRGEFAIFQK